MQHARTCPLIREPGFGRDGTMECDRGCALRDTTMACEAALLARPYSARQPPPFPLFIGSIGLSSQESTARGCFEVCWALILEFFAPKHGFSCSFRRDQQSAPLHAPRMLSDSPIRRLFDRFVPIRFSFRSTSTKFLASSLKERRREKQNRT